MALPAGNRQNRDGNCGGSSPPFYTALSLQPAPPARKPGLLLARQALGPVVVLQLDDPGASHEVPPGLRIMKRAVAPVVPALLVMPVRIGAEQYAARLQRRMQLAQDPRQLLAGHMKQHRIGEYAVEALIGQIEGKKILPPHLAAADLTRPA